MVVSLVDEWGEKWVCMTVVPSAEPSVERMADMMVANSDRLMVAPMDVPSVAAMAEQMVDMMVVTWVDC